MERPLRALVGGTPKGPLSRFFSARLVGCRPPFCRGSAVAVAAGMNPVVRVAHGVRDRVIWRSVSGQGRNWGIGVD